MFVKMLSMETQRQNFRSFSFIFLHVKHYFVVIAGKLVTLSGTVVRAGSIKPLVPKLEFVCPKCGCCFTEALQDGIFKNPTACGGDGCRGKYFVPQKGSAQSIDWQKLRLQASIICAAQFAGLNLPVDSESHSFTPWKALFAPGKHYYSISW